MRERADIVIVGGGVMGLGLAWELSRLGKRKIVVLERRFTGYGASGRNIGRVRTSQFTESLAIFAKAAFAKHMRLGDELGTNTLFWRPGYALVFYDQSEMEPIADICTMLRGLDLTPEVHRGAAVVKRLPILEGGAPPVGCLIRPDAMVHHDALLYGYRRAALARGVDLREGWSVTAVMREGARVAGVETNHGEIRAPLVVNATGGWSSALSRLAGVRVPNVPLRREVLVTESCRPLMDTMITFYRPLEGWFHQTLRGEVVLGAVHPDEPPGLELRASERHLARVAHHILNKAPRLAALRIVRQWAGVYDMTPDRKPMIGPLKQLAGFVQANGDSGRGIALIPYIVELLASWIHTEKRPDPLEAFDTNRYEGREDTPVVVGDYYAAYTKTASSGAAAGKG